MATAPRNSQMLQLLEIRIINVKKSNIRKPMKLKNKNKRAWKYKRGVLRYEKVCEEDKKGHLGKDDQNTSRAYMHIFMGHNETHKYFPVR